jgi:hypothetical protein
MGDFLISISGTSQDSFSSSLIFSIIDVLTLIEKNKGNHRVIRIVNES